MRSRNESTFSYSVCDWIVACERQILDAPVKIMFGWLKIKYDSGVAEAEKRKHGFPSIFVHV